MVLEVHNILLALAVLAGLFYGLGMLTCWVLMTWPEKIIVNPPIPKLTTEKVARALVEAGHYLQPDEHVLCRHVIGGYQPGGPAMDISNPPKGGSGVPKYCINPFGPNNHVRPLGKPSPNPLPEGEGNL